MEKEEQHEHIMTSEELSDKLDALQGIQNDGRGISCVKEMIVYLRMGNIEAARSIAYTDHDKLNNPDYVEVREFIKTGLFRGQDEHPWSHSDKLSEEGA